MTTRVGMVAEFLHSIESHLFCRDQTVLVGDTLTAADVVVALLVAHAVCGLNNNGSSSDTAAPLLLPQQVYRWMNLVLHKLALVVPAEKPVLEAYLSVLAEGDSSPLKKQKPPAVVAAAASDAAVAAEKPAKKDKTPIPNVVVEEAADVVVPEVPLLPRSRMQRQRMVVMKMTMATMSFSNFLAT